MRRVLGATLPASVSLVWTSVCAYQQRGSGRGDRYQQQDRGYQQQDRGNYSDRGYEQRGSGGGGGNRGGRGGRDRGQRRGGGDGYNQGGRGGDQQYGRSGGGRNDRRDGGGGGDRGYGGRGERQHRGQGTDRQPAEQEKFTPPPVQLADPSEAGRIAGELNAIKKRYKKTVNAKERKAILREGVTLARTAQVDPLEPDEKTVALLLNAAAFFELYDRTPVVTQSVSWMRENAGRIEGQHLALFAHAIASLELRNRREIIEGEIAPRLREGAVDRLLPVELVMVLQAIQRAKVHNVDDVVVSIVKRLIDTDTAFLKANIISTALYSLSKLQKRSEDAVRDVIHDFYAKTCPILVEQAPKTHSNDVLTLLHSICKLGMTSDEAAMEMSKPVVQALLVRLNEVMRFYNTEEVPKVFYVVHRLSAEGFGDLDYKPVIEAANERLRRIAAFISFDEAALLCKSALDMEHVPEVLANEVAKGLATQTNFVEPNLGAAARCLRLFVKCNIREDELVRNLVLGLVVETPSRHKDESGEVRRRIRPIGYSFSHALKIRKAAEQLIDGNKFEALGVGLPQRLIQAVDRASERQLVRALAILCAGDDGSSTNNRSNDNELWFKIGNRIDQQGGDAFFAAVNDPKTCSWLVESLAETTACPDQRMLQFLQSQAAAGLKINEDLLMERRQTRMSARNPEVVSIESQGGSGGGGQWGR